MKPKAGGRDHILPPAIAGAMAIHVAMLLTVWGDWRRFAMVAAGGLVMTGSNALISVQLVPRWKSLWSERVRLLLNVAATLFNGYLLHWALPVWMWLPFYGALMQLDGSDGTPRSRFYNVGLIATVDLAALGAGCDPRLPLLFTALCFICFGLAQARVTVIKNLLADRERKNEALEQAHAELRVFHERALAQEKLSSLGLMAAGVAHEINNPMSFVGSNVNALLQDLPSLASDPELMREYREEVIPETLDGIKRVNAIVADLRQFARGDPESLVEYDPDEQVRIAARIVHSRFRDGASLELCLGHPPAAMGRPGQIVQVLVNLLVNARQAVTGPGSVTVTTRQDGATVELSVRDTGEGMDEHTRASLFQPFFTTKPVGEGTGLGLAVVHGIVGAHGGTIAVETARGVGTCFTVRLPLLPPVQLASAA